MTIALDLSTADIDDLSPQDTEKMVFVQLQMKYFTSLSTRGLQRCAGSLVVICEDGRTTDA